MFFRYDTNVRDDKYIVSDRDFSAVHKLAVDIEEKIIAYRGIVSVSAKKRLLYDTVVTGLAEQFAYRRLPSSAVQGVQMVVVVQLFYGDITV